MRNKMIFELRGAFGGTLSVYEDCVVITQRKKNQLLKM